jgi:hypothetical protein
MNMFKHIMMGGLLLGLAFNAAAAKFEPLPMPVEQALPVEVILGQQELEVDVPDNSGVAAQFGLLGALVGSAISNAQVQNAEKRVVDIRNQLVGYRFNEQFEKAIRVALVSEGISPNPQIIIRQTPWDSASAERKLVAGEKQTVLVVVPRYSIMNTFEQMSVSMRVYYVQRELKKNGKPKETYLFNRNYSFLIPMDKLAGSQAAEDSMRWSGLGKDQLVALLDQGIKQVTEMFVYDFSPEGRALSLQPNKGMSGTLNGKKYVGRVLRQTEDFIWVQNGKKLYQTINGFQPITGVPAKPTAVATDAPVTTLPVEAAPPVLTPESVK